MSNLHKLLKARFAIVRQDFEQVLSRLSDADLPWAPREGMRTVGGQLIEIANKETETIAWIRTGVWPEENDEPFGERGSSISGIKAAIWIQ